MIYNLFFYFILIYSKKKYKYIFNWNFFRVMVCYLLCNWNRISVVYIYIDLKIVINYDK